MRISVEDTRTGKPMKIRVKEHHTIERIIDIVIKNMGIISAEQRSYTLVLNETELPNPITIEEAIHKFGLKGDDKLFLWARVIGGN
ncbi:MAG: hypothetical protein ACXADU_00130 [Promethearchaeota archaeon]|jgi:hypothetical protein